MNEETIKEPTKMQTLLGGQTATAQFRDGKTEEVFVRQITIRQIPALSALLDDEPALVEFVCGKEAGWADSLTPESHTQLAELAVSMNSFIMAAWADRQSKLGEALMPKVAKLQNLRAYASQTLSPRPQSASDSPLPKSAT